MTRKRQFVPMLLAAEFAICACSLGQQAQIASNRKPAKAASTHTAKPSPAVAVAATPPISVTDQPSQPATVTLKGAKLSIKANNSTLADILNQVSKAGGMKIDGLQTGGAADERIFGSYGPGRPREVLSQLLDGCGFNVIMLGKTPAGTPKSLSLSPRAPGGVPNPPAQSPAAQYQDYRQNFVAPPTTYPKPRNNTPNPTAQPTQNRVRTPQEILQELERMRQRQQQQRPE